MSRAQLTLLPFDQMNRLFDSHVNDTLRYKRRYCDEIVPVPELCAVQSLCKLLEVLATPQNGVKLDEDRHAYSVICKMWFFFWYEYTRHTRASRSRISLARDSRRPPARPEGWLVGDGLIRNEANSRARPQPRFEY